MKAIANYPHVVIVGAGFGGLYAARALRNVPVRITLIDSHNHHLFQPLLYQVASAALNPSDIAMPIRRIFRYQKNITCLLGKVSAVEPKNKKVIMDEKDVSYDYLILAAGAVNSYYGHEEWSGSAPGLKTIEDARRIRQQVLLAYELAERETSPERQQEWLNFIIVGGGPTGVELAGAYAEISRHTLSSDFRNIRPEKARIVLVQGNERILPSFSKQLSAKAEKKLKELGVIVYTNSKVTGIDSEGVWIGDERIPGRTIIWAAGVKASPIAKTIGISLLPDGRVPVEPDLTVAPYPDFFVIGDLAAFNQDGKMIPGVAPAAIQEGEHAAQNIIRKLQGKPYQPFRYIDKGMVAAIGRSTAVADLPFIKLSGFIAWMAWLFVHIFYLIGFRNRFLVLFEWAWVYFTYERGARLISDGVDKLKPFRDG